MSGRRRQIQGGTMRAALLVVLGCALAVVGALGVLTVCAHTEALREPVRPVTGAAQGTAFGMPVHACPPAEHAPGEHGSDCVAHGDETPDVLLPGPAPEPVPAAVPVLLPRSATGGLEAARPARRAVRALDLHMLQVQRT